MKIMLAVPVAILAAGLMACIPKADAEPEQASSEPIIPDVGNCNAAGLDKHVGSTLTPELQAAIKKQAGATMVRTAPDDGMISMDYNSGRLNIFYDKKKVIVRINCG